MLEYNTHKKIVILKVIFVFNGSNVTFKIVNWLKFNSINYKFNDDFKYYIILRGTRE
jgi:hypothetical protein